MVTMYQQQLEVRYSLGKSYPYPLARLALTIGVQLFMQDEFCGICIDAHLEYHILHLCSYCHMAMPIVRGELCTGALQSCASEVTNLSISSSLVSADFWHYTVIQTVPIGDHDLQTDA